MRRFESVLTVGLVLVMVVMLSVQVSAGRSGAFDSPLSTPTPTLTPTPEPPLPGVGGTEVLRDLLMLLIGGGLAAILVLWFLDAPVGVALADWLLSVAQGMRLGIELPEVRRYASIVLTAVVSLLAYLAAMAFGFVENPGGAAEWLNLVLMLLGVGYPGNQVLHARARRRGS